MGVLPSECQLCGGRIGPRFFDASIPVIGTWACMCPNCFDLNRCKTGIGRGQEYARTEDGRYAKVEEVKA